MPLHPAAVAAVAAAREADAAAMAKSVKMQDGIVAPGATRKARAHAESADDAFEITRSALARLESDLVGLEDNARRSEIDVEGAINGVLAAAGFPVVERFVNLRKEIIELFSILTWLKNRGRQRMGMGSNYREIPALAAPLAELAGEIDAALRSGISFGDADGGALLHPAIEAYQEAAGALRSDPDAPLP
jgi:hypothetical protein